MVAASLIDACLSEPSTTAIALAQKFASTGFRDTSRVGGGNPELGMMMAQYNRQELLRSLCTYRQRLDAFICAIETENWAALEHSLQRTQEARLRFLTSPDSIDSPTDRNSLE
jgi:arogenate dehydrogenase (NADP+)